MGVLSLRKRRDVRYEVMESELGQVCQLFFVVVPLALAALRNIYSRFRLSNTLSAFSPRNFLLDPVSKIFFKKGVKEVGKSTWYPDIVVLEWTETICLAAYVREVFPKAKLVFSEHDLTFTRYERIHRNNKLLMKVLQKSTRNLKSFEMQEINASDLTVVQSKKDASILLANGVPSKKMLVICPFYNQYHNGKARSKEKNILFWGAMNRGENIRAVNWFIGNVFCNLVKAHVDLKFIVVGGGNEKRKGLITFKNVVYTGFVLNPSIYFRDAMCMVAPLSLGAGIKVKILEGMYSGVPVLTGEIGIEGISAKPGEHYFHCEESGDYEKAVLSLLEDRVSGRRMGRKASSFIAAHFDFSSSSALYQNRMMSI